MSQERLKILLIEHDPGFTRTIGEMLGQARELTADISAAPDLHEGFSFLSRINFDVVVLDVSVPDGAGLANISLLKAEAPRLPIIAAGDADNETVAVEAVQAGAQDYLVKAQLTPGWLERSIRYAIERHRMDLTLLAAEEKYHGIFDHLVEGIFQTTPDGHYLLANIALTRIYGYATPEELMRSLTDIGRSLYVDEDRRDEFVRLMQERDTITGFESRIYRKDGTIIWISENCRAIRDAKGALLYYEGTVEDITNRRQAEQDLRNSESLYHSLVETMPQNVFRKDVQGRFTFANQQYCQHYKCKLGDILGKTDFDFFPAELAEQYRRDDWRVMETGQTYEIIEEHHPIGQQRAIIQVVKTPLYGPDGKIVGIQGMFWDITRQRQMEESLRSSEALYHSLVETIPQNIFRKDLNGRYTFANRQFCKTLGKSYDEIIGKTIADFLPADSAAERERDDEKVIKTGKPIERTEESRFSGREREFIQVVKMPIFDAENKVIGIQGMFWDITQQKLAAERIRKANSELARSRKELHTKNQQLEDDLVMAREIQLIMLPQQYPSFPRTAAAADSAFQFTHRYQPTGVVGGDFFTVSALSDTEVSVFICDVAGHGVRSALVTAMIRALLEELKPLAGDPGQFLTKLNGDLHAILRHAGTMLTTAFYLVADCSTGTMRYTNAGHPKPLLVRRSRERVEPLVNIGGKSQPALGLFENATYQTSDVRLSRDDLVMLFTDGLYEVEGANQELYSQDLLVADVQRRTKLSASVMFDEILKQVKQFSADGTFADDVCLVGIDFRGNGAA